MHWPEHYTKAVKLAAARWNVTDLPGVDRDDLEQIAAQRLIETRPANAALAYTAAVRALIDWIRVHGPRTQDGNPRPRAVPIPDVADSAPRDVAVFTEASHEDEVVAAMLHEGRLAWLRQHLPRLPTRQRQVMTHYVEGVSQADSALLLTMSEGTVGAHRHHGKARLAKWAREHRWLH